jgi:hypothetical protein
MFCLPRKSISFVRHSTSHPSRHKAARIAAFAFSFTWIQSGLAGSPSRTVFRGPHARADWRAEGVECGRAEPNACRSWHIVTQM